MGHDLRQFAVRVAFLLTALGAGANTCFGVAPLQAQDTSSVVMMSADTVLTFGQLASYNGITFCVGPQVYSYVQSGMNPIETIDVTAHEAKHREQFARFPNCQAYTAWYRTPAGKLNSEAEAYAAGWCAAKRAGLDDPLPLEAQYLRTLYVIMGGGTPPGEILELWHKYADKCGGANG